MGYIYGIYADDILIYIGKTSRSVEKRFKEHRAAVEKLDDNTQRIHRIIRKLKDNGAHIYMRELYQVDGGADELRILEDDLIFRLQPIGNVQGSLTNKRKDAKV